MTKTLVERWNGTNWSIMTSPNPNAAIDTQLNGVSCASPTSCFAVGQYTDPSSFSKTLVERWNGSSWSIVPSPNPPGATDGTYALLSGVSCPSTTSCFAVGNYSTDQGTYTIPLVERWDGTAWSVVVSTNPSGGNDGVLSGVSCPSTTTCYAVGEYIVGSSVARTLVERWNGTSWSVTSGAGPVGSNGLYLFSVSCPSATSCDAVGAYFDGTTLETLTMQLNGKTWSIVPSPNRAYGNMLYGVSCLSATRCFAVGIDTTGSTNETLTERWNGTSWSILPSPNPSTYSGFRGVSCLPGSCYAVGADGSALIEHWDSARWSVVAPPPSSSHSELLRVSCPSASTCFAVGDYSDGTRNKTLVERWNGTNWSIMTSPNPTAATTAHLNGVSCASTTNCYAVGYSFNGSSTKTLVERWNGTSWSIVPSPNPAGATGVTRGSRLSAVSCADTTSCYAVGNYFTGARDKTLVEHWNGTSWSIVTSPNPAGGYGFLNDVSCPTATSCYAVGGSDTSVTTLVEQWNGTSWSIVTNPSPTGDSFLNSVSCPTTASCVAVGSYPDALSDSNKTLVEQWNGTSWSIVASPNPTATTFISLNGVSCPSATSCEAVGNYSTNSTATNSGTLLEQWDGTNWSIVSDPNPTGATEVAVSGVSCPTTTSCEAVGNYFVRAAQYTLSEQLG